MRDCFTCNYAKRDELNRFISICSGSGNCAYSRFEGEITYTIPEMTEKEFDEVSMKILNEMRKQYPSMTLGDLQTVATFSKMFKEEYIK